ncbi:hypothetical protein D1007_13050 [Hordeum vulgare]|nr:hypothetical protein D1007_13050 [Hordeum vulgare]
MRSQFHTVTVFLLRVLLLLQVAANTDLRTAFSAVVALMPTCAHALPESARTWSVGVDSRLKPITAAPPSLSASATGGRRASAPPPPLAQPGTQRNSVSLGGEAPAMACNTALLARPQAMISSACDPNRPIAPVPGLNRRPKDDSGACVDGMMRITGDQDLQQLMRVSIKNKVLAIMIDHSYFFTNFRQDMIPKEPLIASPGIGSENTIDTMICANVDNPISEVSTVPDNLLSHEGHHLTEANLLADAICFLMIDGVLPPESDFSDSDYDIDDGDDDLYKDNIGYDVVEEAKPEVEDVERDNLLEDEDLNLSIEQQEQLKYKPRAFNSKVDMKSPVFTLGMVFAHVVELRKALTAYGIRNRVQIKKLKNDKIRLEAVRERGCPWLLKGGNDNWTGGL